MYQGPKGIPVDLCMDKRFTMIYNVRDKRGLGSVDEPPWPLQVSKSLADGTWMLIWRQARFNVTKDCNYINDGTGESGVLQCGPDDIPWMRFPLKAEKYRKATPCQKSIWHRTWYVEVSLRVCYV
jgi:hypothetical protein